MRISSAPLIIGGAISLLFGCEAMRPVDGRDTSTASATAKAPSHQVLSDVAVKRAPVVTPTQRTTLAAILPELEECRVVYVGEQHDQNAHHLVQREIIDALYQANQNLAIGVEYFQPAVQPHIDDYIDGRSQEEEMLRATEYFDRWRYDYRLYRPMLQFARDKGIRIVALNVPGDLVRKVARQGMTSLDKQERAQLPQEIGVADEAYRQRLRAVFDQHPQEPRADFENFVAAQLLWDEGMASSVAGFLESNPGTMMVVLAGNGHVAFGSGIPSRVERRVPARSCIVVNGEAHGRDAEVADYIVLPEESPLAPSGRLGVMLEERAGGVVIRGLDGDGGAAAAGMEEGDRIRYLDGQNVASVADVKIALLDRSPGEIIEVQIARGEDKVQTRELDFRVELR